MPEISGFKLPRRLAEIGRPLPIIYVAGDDKPANRRMAAELRALAFFRKPVDTEILLDAIARAHSEWERIHRPR